MRRVGLIVIVVLALAPTGARAEVRITHAGGLYAQVNGPRDAAAGMLFLHASGWRVVGSPLYVSFMAYDARRFARMGVETLNTDYGRGAAGLTDAVGAYDRLRAMLPPRAPIAVFGDSSGGQLGLLVALRRPVTCAIVNAAVLDLGGLAADGDPGLGATARRIFGSLPGGEAAYSPLAQADALARLPILQAGLRDDPIIPFAQQTRFHARLPASTELVGLSRGYTFYIHGGADAAELAALHARQEAFARRCLGLSRLRRPAPAPG